MSRSSERSLRTDVGPSWFGFVDRRARRTTTIVAILAAVSLLPAVASGEEDLPAGAPSVVPGAEPLFSTQLLDAGGRPAAHQVVDILLEVPAHLDDGTPYIQLAPVSTVTTDRRGELRVERDVPPDLARRLDGTQTNIAVYGSDASGGTLAYHLPVIVSGASLLLDGDLSQYVVNPVDDDAASAHAGEEGQLVLKFASGQVPGNGATVMSHGDCHWYEYRGWSPSNTYTTRWLGIQRTRTRGASKARYEWETTHNSRFEVVNTGTWGTFSGGMSASRENATAAGLISNLPINTTRMVEVQWEYRRWNLICVNSATGSVRDTGSRQWRPNRWTSGNRNTDGVSGFSCKAGTSTKISNTTWVARSTSSTTSNSASIGGISLRSTQTNSGSHRLAFEPTGSKGATICGDTDWPTSARRVREL